MNPIVIVLPILTILMYEIGLNLRVSNLKLIASRPKPVIVGLIGQIVVLPMVAFVVATMFDLPPVMFIGVMLIACCPGGSSSNIFSLLAGGDIGLSVLLTTLSSVLTLITIPIVMAASIAYVDFGEGLTVELPVGRMIVQNVALMLVPIVLGVLTRRYTQRFAEVAHKVLSKMAFPMLLLLASIFFMQHYDTIVSEFASLGGCIITFMMIAIFVSVGMGWAFGLERAEKRTIVMEVGMQNAASAIAIASSPFIFNNDMIAVPAIIYALVMNVVLLSYLQIVKRRKI